MSNKEIMNDPVWPLFKRFFDKVGTRLEPLCIAWHNQYGWVPIIKIEIEEILWDDYGEWDTNTIPYKYEYDKPSQFNWDKHVYE